MSIYLDSAIVAEAQAAKELGWVKGITTNPTLLAKSDLPVETTLKRLTQLTTGPVFYQLMSSDFDEMLAEGRAAFEIIGKQTVLKIPASMVGFQVVAALFGEISCAVTGIYSASQAAVAKEAGAKYAIAYVNRATKLLGDGIALLQQMSSVVAGSNTEIMAASIKSPEEAVASLQAGAQHLTLPLTMLQAMTTHELSLQTIDEFNKNGRGLWVSCHL
ncbi:transaldolase [Tolypothrix sp. FACHB-123]|uniref:transaldolase family protein n=1 Tax=Tolypothrix sp. FACHB-123 TaxID=2692868 RepID=UPI0016865E54|nr:transaldolase family protein [Tolypothrix sp. FACHB-123]MBD2356686.1 transaldolase [Tolypothrix sp. FACHB-123]